MSLEQVFADGGRAPGVDSCWRFPSITGGREGNYSITAGAPVLDMILSVVEFALASVLPYLQPASTLLGTNHFELVQDNSHRSRGVKADGGGRLTPKDALVR